MDSCSGQNNTTPLDTSNFFRSTPTIIPTVGAASGDAITHIENMIELKSRGWWDPGEMLTHRMRFDEVNRAYDMYESYEDGVIKVVIGL